ncbi:sec-independent protein translocase protein TatA [Saccharothrix saharensis]|uniref:Sec-independent protein translocase protein TatA n=1 Tax=Saccharothrix saharensis TaxID=571190 RepID=A0A543JPS5_9PSEU|nr:Sec-independent protein translocase subunit TatA [Saccharothrix saharensis]TQM84808.1 sec-independent protein translocase protein TatA [Saccharothrix saharensis]
MPNLGPTELIIIAVVIILLFGAKKLPDMARSIGRSAKILKAETKGLRSEDDPQQQPGTTAQQAPAPQQLPPVQPQVAQQPVAQQPVAQPQQVVQPVAQPVQPQVAQPIEQSAQNLQNKQNTN